MLHKKFESINLFNHSLMYKKYNLCIEQLTFLAFQRILYELCMINSLSVIGAKSSQLIDIYVIIFSNTNLHSNIGNVLPKSRFLTAIVIKLFIVEKKYYMLWKADDVSFCMHIRQILYDKNILYNHLYHKLFFHRMLCGIA